MNATQNCQFCNIANHDTAKYCQKCGRPLGATLLQGRTVVIPKSPPPAGGQLKIDPRTIIARARKAFGAGSTVVGYPSVRGNLNTQHEDMYLVGDVSSSMEEEFDRGIYKIEALRRASVSLVINKNQIDPEDRIGVITFCEQADILLGLTSIGANKLTLIKTIQDLEAAGGTDIEKGLAMARDHFDWSRTDVVRRITLLTDGEDDSDPIPTANDLKRRGVIIDVIGIGASPSNVNEKLLKGLSSTIEGEVRYRFIKNHRSLIDHYTRLANKTSTLP